MSTQAGTNKTRTSKNPILDTKEEDKEEDTEEEKKKFTDVLHEHTESTKRSDLMSQSDKNGPINDFLGRAKKRR